GNVLYDGPGGATAPVHYGGDQGVAAAYRKGVLHFYSNTFVSRSNQAQSYRVEVFDMSAADTFAGGGGAVDARDNVFDLRPASGAAPEFDLMTPGGVGYFGRNWVTGGWQASTDG